ncbi:MAG TPA: hypothetical protein VGJ52_04555 [Vicinamibacterales bacterium]|jgi:hypothetical protein
MIGRLAVRSLTAHPVRSAVLAAGFGVGVSVMAILLGVADVVLTQARSSDLVGGGDVVIHLEPSVPARMVMSGTLQSDQLRNRVRLAGPSHTSALYLVKESGVVRVDAHGGIPSVEQAMDDPEVALNREWRDTPEDVAWTQATPEAVLRQIDRFHDVPDAPMWQDSWAEWLYFNGRAHDARFYLTFMVGPKQPDGLRPAGVRLQLDRGGHVENFSASARLSQEEALRAPELTIGANRVRLEGLRYVIDLDLRGEGGRVARGRIGIEASPGRLVPPIEIGGAHGWRTGYVVPVMSGQLGGTLDVAGEPIPFDGGAGYHDHNWGFWRGVSWQWGQAQQGDLSLIYGRVFPPRDAADPERIPGFVGALGPDGPLGYATNVTIAEMNDAQGRPKTITVTARSRLLDVSMRFDVGSMVTTRTPQGTLANGLDFLQMRGQYTVSGRAGDRTIEFTAPGSAETFRENPKTQIPNTKSQ